MYICLYIWNRKSHQKKIKLNVRLFCLHFIRSRKICLLFQFSIFHRNRVFFSDVDFSFFLAVVVGVVVLLLFHLKRLKFYFLFIICVAYSHLSNHIDFRFAFNLCNMMFYTLVYRHFSVLLGYIYKYEHHQNHI